MRPNAIASGADNHHLRFGAAALARLADPLPLPNFSVPVSIFRWHFQKEYAALLHGCSNIRLYLPFSGPSRRAQGFGASSSACVDDRGECALTRIHPVYEEVE
jgi:hypothetical protein